MWAMLACPVPLRTLKSIRCSFKLWGNDMLLMSMNLLHSQMCFHSLSLLKWKQEGYAFLKRRLFSGHECLFDRMPPLIWKAVQSPAPQIASSSVLANVISSYFLLETWKRKMDSVQTCSPPTSQKARAGSSVTLSCHKSSSSTPVSFIFFTLSQFIKIYLMVILPVLMHNSVE